MPSSRGDDHEATAATAALGAYTEVDQAVVGAMTLPAWPTEINRESVERLAELAIVDGLLDEHPDLDGLLP